VCVELSCGEGVKGMRRLRRFGCGCGFVEGVGVEGVSVSVDLWRCLLGLRRSGFGGWEVESLTSLVHGSLVYGEVAEEELDVFVDCVMSVLSTPRIKKPL